jgi:SulP family sulfate permease
MERNADLIAGEAPEGASHLAEEPEAAGPPPFQLRELFVRYLPALGSLRNNDRVAWRRDLIAGLTVASLAVPQAMAYAIIAGLPPQYGLYTAIVMTVVGALLDPTGKLINGPTNAISIALFSALVAIHDVNMRVQVAIALAFLVGLIQTGITLLRLGDLTRYVSHAVIVGFTLGAAVLIVLSQFQHLVGLDFQGRGPPRDEHFLKRFWLTLLEIEHLDPWTTAIGVGTIVLVLGTRWLNHRFALRLPELLLAVIVMALCVWLGDLEQEVSVVGEIPRGLAGLQIPMFADGPSLHQLSGSALAIALLGLLEAIAMAKVIAAKTGKKLDINQQCLSEGLANLAGSFFQCFPGSGSLTRSAINQEAGAASQWAGIIAAAAVALTMLLLAPCAYYIPHAVLAGILMVSAYRLVEWNQLAYYLRATRFDAIIVIATALSAVLISVEVCIFAGVVLSFLLYVPRAAHVHLTELILTKERVLRERLPGDTPCGRLLLFAIEGELFFGSAPELDDALAQIARRVQNGIRAVVLRVKRVRNADAVCLALLDTFLRQMEKRKLTVLLCGVRGDLANVLHTSGLEARLGNHRVFREVVGSSSTVDAVRHAYDLLDGDLCQTCPRRGEAAQSKEVLYYMI